MWLALLFACEQSSPLKGDILTEGGTWHLNLEQTQYDQGAVQLQLWAETATDATPANDLTIFIQPMMDGMSHPLDLVDFVGQGEGAYLAEVVLDMSGLWTLSGYAGDANLTESFSFVVEVLP